MGRREIDEMVIWQRRVLRPMLLRQRVMILVPTLVIVSAIFTVMVLVIKLT